MKKIYCQNIIDGKLCGKKRWVKKQAHRTKYCPQCAADIQKQQSCDNYHKNHSRIRKQQNALSRKRGKPGSTKSSKQTVKCKCPTCEGIHYHQIFLMEPERYKDKPFPKRCDPCANVISRDGYCADAHGHAVATQKGP